MGRNTSSNITGFHVRAKIYPKITKDEDILRHNMAGKVFYAKDYTQTKKSRIELGEVITRNRDEIAICTVDLKEGDIDVDFKVEYGGKIYLVNDFDMNSVNIQNETRSRNHDTFTVIKLVR